MKIGIVGATGEVGLMMIKVLQEEKIYIEELTLFSSQRSAGEKIKFYDQEITVKELTEESMQEKYDYILFSAGSTISRKYATIATKAGNIIIDNSSAFRQDKRIPLVIPEINSELLTKYRGIIANPNCSTIQMLLALANLHKKYEIKKIIVSTYQAVSGAGNRGIQSLINEQKNEISDKYFKKQIYRNVVPQIGDFHHNGYSDEEIKMDFETKKILKNEAIDVVATTVRVPVFYGHSESIYVEFNKEVNLQESIEVLQKSESVVFHLEDYITPIEIENSNMSHVCRLRYGADNYSLNLWNVANNVRVGAATNAVRILKKHFQLNII